MEIRHIWNKIDTKFVVSKQSAPLFFVINLIEKIMRNLTRVHATQCILTNTEVIFGKIIMQFLIKIHCFTVKLIKNRDIRNLIKYLCTTATYDSLISKIFVNSSILIYFVLLCNISDNGASVACNFKGPKGWNCFPLRKETNPLQKLHSFIYAI